MMQQTLIRNPQYKTEYSELLGMTTDSSDSSGAYTIPAYRVSDAPRSSITSAIYHQPNCQCHMAKKLPISCETHRTDTTDSSNAGGNYSGRLGGDGSDVIYKEKLMRNEEQCRHSGGLKKPIIWIWIILTFAIFLLSILSITQASWIINSETGESLGLIRQNKIDLVSNQLIAVGYQGISASLSWKIALILLSLSTALLGLSSVLTFTIILISTIRTKEKLSFLCGYLQLFAVILMITSLIFYMVGLDSPTATSVCHTSSVFNMGECQIGWSYLILIVCCAFGLLLPVLSHYVDYMCLVNSQQQQKDRGTCVN